MTFFVHVILSRNQDYFIRTSLKFIYKINIIANRHQKLIIKL